VGEDAPHGVRRLEPLRPRCQPRRPRRVHDPDADHLLDHPEPPQVAPEHDVEVPDGVAAEERLPLGALTEGPFHELERLDRLLHLRRLLLRLRRRRLQNGKARREHLAVDEGGPEASDGAVVGVGGEQRGGAAGERLVDVLDDDQRVAHRLAVVDEHGHRLVHRVAVEEELALAGEVLGEVVVRQALDGERHLRADHVRAHAGQRPQQLQLLSHRSLDSLL
ncbi:hypothetical protein EE612_052424, partial [Oryza sativa]